MSQQLGNEVERPGKANKSTIHPGELKEKKSSCPGWDSNPRHSCSLFSRGAALGGIRTHDTLQSRRALYQLSYQGNSAVRGSNVQHNTTQGKPQTTCAIIYMVCTGFCFCIFRLGSTLMSTPALLCILLYFLRILLGINIGILCNTGESSMHTLSNR